MLEVFEETITTNKNTYYIIYEIVITDAPYFKQWKMSLIINNVPHSYTTLPKNLIDCRNYVRRLIAFIESDDYDKLCREIMGISGDKYNERV